MVGLAVKRILDRPSTFTPVKGLDRVLGKNGKSQPVRRPAVVPAAHAAGNSERARAALRLLDAVVDRLGGVHDLRRPDYHAVSPTVPEVLRVAADGTRADSTRTEEVPGRSEQGVRALLRTPPQNPGRSAHPHLPPPVPAAPGRHAWPAR